MPFPQKTECLQNAREHEANVTKLKLEGSPAWPTDGIIAREANKQSVIAIQISIINHLEIQVLPQVTRFCLFVRLI